MSRPKREKLEAEDTAVLYDLAWRQMKEDRDFIVEQYKEIRKAFTVDQDMGEVLVKCSETLVKQTAQVLELVKLAKKQVEEDSGLSEEDMDDIKQQLAAEQNKDIIK